MTKHLVVVAGNLGAGKSEFVERVGSRLKWNKVHESVIDNPYLADFYADMRAWSFHLQIYFLGHRARRHLEATAGLTSAIMDRSIYEDANVFAPALLRLGNMTDRDYQAYRRIYDLLVTILPRPSLLVYLDAPSKVLLQRVHERGLEFEHAAITENYLSLIGQFYEKWTQQFDLCPILRVNTADLDYVHKATHLDIVTASILRQLRSPPPRPAKLHGPGPTREKRPERGR
jgi:deoxyadenosine/deoxycytidine kinase